MPLYDFVLPGALLLEHDAVSKCEQTSKLEQDFEHIDHIDQRAEHELEPEQICTFERTEAEVREYFSFILELHRQVLDSGAYNFELLRISLHTNFNIPVWRSLLTGYV